MSRIPQATLVVAALLLAALAAVPAQAAPWLAPLRVTNPGQNIGAEPQITVGPRGGMVALSKTTSVDGTVRLQAAVRDAASAPSGTGEWPLFGAPVALSNPFLDSERLYTGASVDPAGNVIVMWWAHSFTGGAEPSPVWARIKPAGKGWLPAQQLSSQGYGFNSPNVLPQLQSSSRGHVAVLTEAGLFERAPGAERFVAVPDSDAASFSLNGAGDLALGFYGVVRYRPVGGSWSSRPLGEVYGGYPFEAYSERTKTVVTENGTVVASWVQGNEFEPKSTDGLYAAVRQPGVNGTWTTQSLDPEYLNGGGGVGAAARLTVVGAGAVRASWGDGQTRILGGTADPLVTHDLAKISHLGGGRAVYVPAARPAGTITARTRSKYGETFAAATTVLAPSGTATAYTPRQLSLDDQGNGTLLWDRTIQEAGKPEAHLLGISRYDPIAPVIASSTVPATATVGQTVAFSATATDRMANPALTWAFGDGATATGSAVTRAYAQPGTYAVTVTATDDAGNLVRQTRSIVVSAPQKVSADPRLWTPSYAGGRTLVRTLELFSVRAGDSVKLACVGTGCTAELNRTFAVSAAASKLVTAFNGSAGISLATGAKLTVTVGRSGWASQTATFTMQAGTAPARVLG